MIVGGVEPTHLTRRGEKLGREENVPIPGKLLTMGACWFEAKYIHVISAGSEPR